MSTTLMGLCWPLQMPPTPKAVLISLADNANDQGYCWPSIAKISERTCFSKRAVIDAIAWLEQSGILAADRTNGRHTTYVINPSDFVKPVQQAHQCISRTGASPASEPVQQAHQPVHLPHQPVQQLHTNHQEPSLTVIKSNRQKRAPALVDLSKFDFSVWPSAPEAQVFTDWIALRKKKRADVSETVMRTMGAELHRAAAKGYTVDEALGICVLRGWQGLEAKWLDPKTGGNHAANRNDHRESLAERAERIYAEGEAREAAIAAEQGKLGHGW